MARDATADAALAYPHPRARATLFGQEAAEVALLRAWRANRLAHAYLLTGPRGIGKATLAFRFARFLLSGARPDAGLFGDGPTSMAIEESAQVFRHVAAGTHPDLLTIEKSFDDKRKRMREEIVVDDVRAAPDFFGLTAGRGGWRIAIVDAADDLNRNAANALLKILEEPPRQGLLLVVAHAPGRLLPTIRSRCQKLALAPLDDATVGTILDEAYPEMAAEDRSLLLRLAEGSAGRVLDLAAMGGATSCRELVALLDSAPKLDLAATQVLGERLARPQAAAQFEAFTNLLTWWLARLIRAGAGEPPAAALTESEPALIARLLAATRLDRWVEVWEKVSAFLARADALNLDRRQAIVLVFSAIAQTAAGQRPDLPE